MCGFILEHQKWSQIVVGVEERSHVGIKKENGEPYILYDVSAYRISIDLFRINVLLNDAG